MKHRGMSSDYVRLAPDGRFSSVQFVDHLFFLLFNDLRIKLVSSPRPLGAFGFWQKYPVEASFC